MFEIVTNIERHSYYVANGEDYLHSDGNVYKACCEYWPTRELAQAVLDKHQPPHVWEHGDVLETLCGRVLMCVQMCNRSLRLISLGKDGQLEPNYHLVSTTLYNSIFLFNIKDKL